jgi:hypothetical protein
VQAGVCGGAPAAALAAPPPPPAVSLCGCRAAAVQGEALSAGGGATACIPALCLPPLEVQHRQNDQALEFCEYAWREWYMSCTIIYGQVAAPCHASAAKQLCAERCNMCLCCRTYPPFKWPRPRWRLQLRLRKQQQLVPWQQPGSLCQRVVWPALLGLVVSWVVLQLLQQLHLHHQQQQLVVWRVLGEPLG